MYVGFHGEKKICAARYLSLSLSLSLFSLCVWRQREEVHFIGSLGKYDIRL